MKQSRVISIITSIVLIVVLLGVVGLLVGYMNKDGRSFYLENGNSQIYRDYDSYVFREDTCYVFDVKSSLGLTSEQVNSVDYSVKVVLNPSTLQSKGYQSYIVDEHFMTFNKEIDCTEFFILHSDSNRFLFRFMPDLTLEDLLTVYHDPSTVSSVPDVDLYSANYLTLVVTNNLDNTSIRLGLVREVVNE